MFSCCPKLTNLIASIAICGALFAAGAWIGTRAADSPTATTVWRELLPVAYNSPDNAARGKNLSVATGWIDEDGEGVFVLDHLTGNLQCFVLNARSGTIGAVYRTNVLADLDTSDRTDADYVLVTGQFNFSRVGRTAQQQYAQCICYVGESNSGRFAGYSFAFNATAAARGEVQVGELARVMNFSIRDEGVLRD